MNEHKLPGGFPPSSNPGEASAVTPAPSPSSSLPRVARSAELPGFGAGVEGGAPSGAAAASAGGERKSVRRRRGGSRRSGAARRKASGEGQRSDSGAEDSGDSSSASSSNGKAETTKKRSGRRRTRRRSSGSKARGETEEITVEAEEAASEKPARRRRGKRSTKAAETASSTAEAEPEEEASDDKGAGGRKRRKRGSRGGRGRRKKPAAAVEIEVIPGEEDELPELADLPADAVIVEDEKQSKKKSSRSRRRKSSSADEKPASRRKAKTSRSKTTKVVSADDLDPADRSVILVNAGDPEETRVVVVKKGRISDLQMTVKKHVSFVSDIYRGRVVNLEPAIGAAFVDFGQGRNGFLHASDVLPCYGESDWRLEKLLTTAVDSEWDVGSPEAAETEDEPKKQKEKGGRGRGRGRARRPRMPIEKLVKKGQLVAVQITKDAIGDKGPTLTTYVSIPGRYLVLMPSLERTGVSRKIEDEKERRRLKKILSSMDIPEGMGVIVRTAGVGRTKAELTRDLEYLLLAWEDFSKRLVSGRNPAPLYQESDAAVRTMRDLFSGETEKVVVDDDEVYERMVEFTTKLMPEHLDRVQRHEGARPLFQSFGVEQDFEKIFARRVELPSGGSIVIDQTEALVAIDVNSGRTREEGAEFEDIALKTNLEAVKEIARQIRLRDLGGIIVLDYIDMMRASGRRAVEKATREALKTDRARSKIGRISQFGLLELTRQRLGPGLSKLVYETCLRCRGSGRQRSVSSRAQAILRRLSSSLLLKGFSTVEVRAHPEVIDYLERNLSVELDALEHDSGRKLVLMSVPEQLEDSVLHYLRADGREVRPGGRRKR